MEEERDHAMKIIGKTLDAYLVEVTENELAYCAGFSGSGWWRDKHPEFFTAYSTGYGQSYTIKIGVVFDVKTPHEMFTRLRDQESKVVDAVGILTTCATLLRQSVPTFATTPESDNAG